MLVLARKVGEVIRIGEDITIHVGSIKGGTVRIGISAPQSVQITRPSKTVENLSNDSVPPEVRDEKQ